MDLRGKLRFVGSEKRVLGNETSNFTFKKLIHQIYLSLNTDIKNQSKEVSLVVGCRKVRADQRAGMMKEEGSAFKTNNKPVWEIKGQEILEVQLKKQC